MNKPLDRHEIDVLLPVYNGAVYLPEALDSIVTQTFRDWRLLIINDGSTDNSLEIIKQYATIDPRISYRSRNNKGLVATLNELTQWSSAAIIARMDADDICLNDRLEKQFSFLEKNQQIDIVGSWVQLFGTKNEIWHYRATHAQIRFLSFFGRCSLLHASLMCKRRVFDSYPFDVNFTHLEDFDFLCRIIADDQLKMAAIREPLYQYRQHATSVVYQHENVRMDKNKTVYARFLRSLGLELSVAELDVLQSFNYGIFHSSHNIDYIGRVVKKAAEHLCQNNEDVDREFAYRWLIFCLNNVPIDHAYDYFRKYFDDDEVVFLICKKQYLENMDKHGIS